MITPWRRVFSSISLLTADDVFDEVGALEGTDEVLEEEAALEEVFADAVEDFGIEEAVDEVGTDETAKELNGIEEAAFDEAVI